MWRRSKTTALSPLPPVHLSVSPTRLGRWVLIVCLTIEIGFVLLDYHVNYGRLTEVGAMRRLTNIAREDGLASWFGTTQTLLLALTAWGVWLLARAASAARWRQVGWGITAAMFTYMAVDDGAQLHERLGSLWAAISERGGSSLLDVFPSYPWQVLFVPVFGVFGAGLAVFVWYELGERYSLALVAAALACLATAVGLDFIEGLDEDHPWNLYTWISLRTDLSDWSMARFRQTPYDTLEHFSRSLEEFLEMAANTFVWVAFIRHLPRVAQDVRVRVAQ